MSVTGPTRGGLLCAMRYGARRASRPPYLRPPAGLRFLLGLRLTLNREGVMAATRKTAKRGAGKKAGSKKRSTAKRSSAKTPARKASSKRRGKSAVASKAASLKRKARKGLKAARSGLKTVRKAGEKTWKRLTRTTAHVVGEIRKR